MRRLRPWLWFGAALLAVVALSLLLQAVNTLLWQLNVLLPAWLVGPVLLLIIGAGGLLALRLAWPWLLAWRGPRRRNVSSQALREPLASRQEAAERNLQAIDQVLERVRDDVAKEVLRQEREQVEADLARGDLVLVLFGAGSSGKTSLIRALLNEVVGEVGAPMGSTADCHSYQLRLKGLRRGLQLVDTPGILEAGADGRQRETNARQRAARADLLILVVDGDLRATELEVFEALAGLGKRLILVLNKCDLRGDEEERRLLQLLRQRTAGRIEAGDVIPASAAPQSVPRPGGQPLQPAPEIEALLQRLATVLKQDGEELIADNILLQSRRLGDASREMLSRQRRRDSETLIERYMWIGAGVLVVTPLPVVDLLGTAAVNAQMVMEIGRVYGVEISRASGQELALSVGRSLAGLGVIKGGLGLIGSALTLNLPALALSKVVQGVSAAWLTRIAGQSVLTYFEQDQDWGDGGLQEVVRRQYDLNRREGALKSFLEAAYQRVVEPLQRRKDPQLPPRPGPREGGAGAGRGRRAR